MSSTTVARHYARLLSLWPKDPLRPTLPFTKTLERRAARFAPASEASSTQDDKAKAPKANVKAAPQENGARSSSVTASSMSDPKAELVNINAVYSLLENRYSKRYPTSPGLLRPASNPEHYEKLMEEIKRAPTKSWLRAKLDQWKMMIRWK
ncbi:hypothetical protein K469DRAFT_684766 [Zopfia rhizophila CBS 207.26]|uniref:Uncharacterized protein n=1 Tax=Zopfia rhizophila CBS 207.26 TaxID=1314779 RepID=A0A6A6D6H7_9PEZI|nr:hypothetical protein K469DRAFT_684766 [Zopfia rhizophila CBS 207.26]